jgi:hypothetical protein
VRDANGQALAYVYRRPSETDAMQANFVAGVDAATVDGPSPRPRPQSKQVPPWRPRISVAQSDPIQTFYRTTQLQTSELQLSVWHNCIALLCLDPCLFDNWPPFFGISFSHCL